MKKRKLFKILKQKKDCVLLAKDQSLYEAHQVLYQVRDIENDIVFMGYIYDNALDFFENYDIEKVREGRKKVFEDWLEEFAGA